jgi:hypothetical protein
MYNDSVAVDQVRLLSQDGYTQHQNWRDDFEQDPHWTFARSSSGIPYWFWSDASPRPGSLYCYQFNPVGQQQQGGEWSDLISPYVELPPGNYVLAYNGLGDMGHTLNTNQFEVWRESLAGELVMISVPGRVWLSAGGQYPGISYPASYVNSIAIGACNDLGVRSHYSRYGLELFAVAASNGGGWNDVVTTDTRGASGRNNGAWNGDGDYTMDFGGTSAATPLAAGVAALVLSKNANLLFSELKVILRDGCEKIGGVTYDGNGWHQEYGYGRINAGNSLFLQAPDNTAPTVSSVAARTGRAIEVTFTEQMGEGVTTPANYTISGQGQGTLAAHPASVSWISGNKFALEWAGGEMVAGTGNLTVTVSTAVKDIAGVAVGTPNSGTASGTAPIYLIGAGSWKNAESVVPIYPFEADRYVSPPPVGTPQPVTVDSVVENDGTPLGVYQSERCVFCSPTYPGDIYYYLPNITAGLGHKVRLYFIANGYSVYPGDVVFSVYINNVLKLNSFDLIGAAGGVRKGIWREFSNITADGYGYIWVRIVPQATSNRTWGGTYYNATISGIRVTPEAAPLVTPLVTGVTSFGYLRRDFGGWVGFQFTVGSAPLNVTELGRWVVSGNSSNHVVKLFYSDGTPIPNATVTVSTAGKPAGQFTYATLATPVTLTAGTTYAVMSQEVSGQYADQWYDYYGTSITLSGAASGAWAVYAYDNPPPPPYYGAWGGSGKSYGPVNLKAWAGGGSGTPLVTGVTSFGSLRNDWSGWVGFQFTVGGTPLTVTELGRWVVSGNSSNHVVKLFYSNGAPIPNATVTVSTAGKPAGFTYATLATPVALAAGTTYAVMSQEVSGQYADQWYDYYGTSITLSGAASGAWAVWAESNPPPYYGAVGGSGKSYGPVNLRY